MKGFFLVLLGITVGALLVIPMSSMVAEERPAAHHMTIYSVLLIAWIILGIAFGIAYLASEGSKGIKHIPLPVTEEDE
jgi:DMSO reductase anchor subunit